MCWGRGLAGAHAEAVSLITNTGLHGCAAPGIFPLFLPMITVITGAVMSCDELHPSLALLQQMQHHPHFSPQRSSLSGTHTNSW